MSAERSGPAICNVSNIGEGKDEMTKASDDLQDLRRRIYVKARLNRRGGGWKRGMVEIVGHSQTKGRDNREPKLRPKPARQSSTLLMSGDGKRSVGHRPQATAPILDSLPPQCGPDLKADEKVE